MPSLLRNAEIKELDYIFFSQDKWVYLQLYLFFISITAIFYVQVSHDILGV